MSVRARMFVSTITKSANDTGSVNLQAVSRGEENKQWASYTPSGQVTLNLSRKAGPAMDWFEERVGKEVFVDFSDATEPEPSA